jgi:hypothetical protein
MNIINNKKDYEDNYPYDFKPKRYPTEYPCIMNVKSHDAGLMGSCKNIHFYYPPQNIKIKTLLKCLECSNEYFTA